MALLPLTGENLGDRLVGNLLGLGYTHVVWCREVKGYGPQGLQKHRMGKFARLAQRLNGG